ncbi:protein-disulfide reductase DsbD domain-containing protein [Candidatus Halocynthiibacter alkanivorans]|uniref:protein-disulfide reductase DsbD domain-containing protein n=1 Tax=Candidatus Halocynthiibacter alkanivorans TaxID=2267619 RepID=UPI001F2DA347|nr:protein-disulfide reductase DsbD domain-containing protein [Candidatus Halocynthiibacter alkanivorans]
MRIFSGLPSFVLAVFAAFATAAPAISQVAGDAVEASEMAQVDLLPGWRRADGVHMAALRVRLAPGWKTYWRSPGQAGIPPGFDWSGSQNLASATPRWPAPKAFENFGLRSLGYKNELLLPLELRPRDPGAPIRLDVTVVMGVCYDICLPLTVTLQQILPTDVTTPDTRIRQALARGPASAAAAGVRNVTCRATPIEDGLRLRAELDMPALGGDEITVFELPDREIWIAEASTTRQGGRLSAETELVPPGQAPFSLDRSTLRITVIGEKGAVDIKGCKGG